jgi:hypothetical protein
LQNTTLNGIPVVTFDGGNAAQPDEMISAVNVSARTIFLANVSLTGNGDCCNPIVGNQNSYVSIRRLYPIASTIWSVPGNDADFTYPAGTMRVDGVSGNVSILGTPQVLTAERSGAAFTFTKLKLAQHNGYATRAWGGNLGEVVMFDRVLNSAETVLVDNYLSSKFNIALNTGGGALDVYSGDTALKGDYDFDIFGIGRLDATNQVTTAGLAGFGIEATGGTLGDNEWVLAGHNVTTNSLTTNDLPVGIYGRWDRVWYVDENLVGGVDVSLAFDFSDAGLGPPVGNSFRLLYSQTDPFSFTDLGLTPIAAGDLVTFSVSDALLATGYYTLGLVPEPSTLAMLLGLGGLGLLGYLRRRRRS